MPKKIILPSAPENDLGKQEVVEEKPMKTSKKTIVYETDDSETDDDNNISIEKPKVKRAQTEKQLQAWRKAQETKLKNDEMRRELKRLQELEYQKQRDEKIVKKALSIKKKQIKKEQILDEISDDDTPIESLPKRKPRPQTVQPVVQQPIKPKFNFV